jgi:hypothetical protein
MTEKAIRSLSSVICRPPSVQPEALGAFADPDPKEFRQRLGGLAQPRLLGVRQRPFAPPIAFIVLAGPCPPAARIAAIAPVAEAIVEREADQAVLEPERQATPRPELQATGVFTSLFQPSLQGEGKHSRSRERDRRASATQTTNGTKGLPRIKEGRRSAGRRHCLEAASRIRMLPPACASDAARATDGLVAQTARFGRARLSALHRGTRRGQAPAQLQSGAS